MARPAWRKVPEGGHGEDRPGVQDLLQALPILLFPEHGPCRLFLQSFAPGEVGDLGLEGALDVVQVVHLRCVGSVKVGEIPVEDPLLHDGGGGDLEVHVAEQGGVVLVLVAVLGARQGGRQADYLRALMRPIRYRSTTAQ